MMGERKLLILVPGPKRLVTRTCRTAHTDCAPTPKVSRLRRPVP